MNLRNFNLILSSLLFSMMSASAQFNVNLSAREVSAEKKRAVSRNFTNSLLDYDVHISEFLLPAASSLCGKSLKAINVRSHTGASIVRIVRSGININIPGGTPGAVRVR